MNEPQSRSPMFYSRGSDEFLSEEDLDVGNLPGPNASSRGIHGYPGCKRLMKKTKTTIRTVFSSATNKTERWGENWREEIEGLR
jgi:hypothetical protein